MIKWAGKAQMTGDRAVEMLIIRMSWAGPQRNVLMLFAKERLVSLGNI